MSISLMLFVLFFFNQMTAYEMRISDWSSDVCSSDLVHHGRIYGQAFEQPRLGIEAARRGDAEAVARNRAAVGNAADPARQGYARVGRRVEAEVAAIAADRSGVGDRRRPQFDMDARLRTLDCRVRFIVDDDAFLAECVHIDAVADRSGDGAAVRSEEHTSEL